MLPERIQTQLLILRPLDNSDADDVLEYQFTVEDPSTWETPWTAVINYTASEDPIFEYACHEGNYSMAGILGGWRRLEALGQTGQQ